MLDFTDWYKEQKDELYKEWEEDSGKEYGSPEEAFNYSSRFRRYCSEAYDEASDALETKNMFNYN